MPEKIKRAAHFLLHPELTYSPPNEAIVSALLFLGYHVDLYAPGGALPTDAYGPNVSAYSVEYGKRWIVRNILSNKWREYDLFSGTCEDPMGVVGVLSYLYHRPCFTLADEIKAGSYRGDAPGYWKKLCIWGMRQSQFTIVNDESRISLQKKYANLSGSHNIIVYPGCYRNPPKPADRIELRSRWGIPKDAIVIVASGGFNLTAGAEWLIEALQAKKDLYVVIQPLGIEPLTRFLLCKIEGRERLYIEKRRLDWNEAWSSMAAADICIAIYLNEAPQFQNMGTSSNRLCMALAMGLPVITSCQASFKFVEKYDCGVMVSSQNDFIKAIKLIGDRLDQMKINALRCSREFIDSPAKYEILVQTLKEF